MADDLFLNKRAALRTHLVDEGQIPVDAPRVKDDPQLTRFAQRVAEIINTRFGDGSAIDQRAVTYGDLFKAGVVEIRGADGTFRKPSGAAPRDVRWLMGGAAGAAQTDAVTGPPGPIGPPGPPADPPVYPEPTVPTNLVVSATISSIFLTWDAQDIDTVAYVEVWASATNNLATANKIANAYTNLYVDAVGATGVQKWYWIRSVGFDPTDPPSAYNAVSGVSGQTGKIGTTDLANEIVIASKLADGAIDLDGYKVTQSGYFGKLAVGYTVTQYLVAQSGFLENLVVTSAQVQSLAAEKITTGYLSANRIQVGSIDARIAQITDAQIQNLSANKIIATYLSAITANLGFITAGNIDLHQGGGGSWSHIRSANKWWWDGVSGFVAAGYQPNASYFFDVTTGNSYLRMSNGPSVGTAAELSFNGGTILLRGSDGYAQFTNVYARGNVEATSLNAYTADIVASLHLQNNAVIIPASNQNFGQQYFGNNSWQTICQVSINLPEYVGLYIICNANLFLDYSGAYGDPFWPPLWGIRLLGNAGENIWTTGPAATAYPYNAPTFQPLVTIGAKWAENAGTRTFSLQFFGATGAVSTFGSSMMVLGTRKSP